MAVVSLTVLIQLFHRVYPESAIQIPVSRDEIKQKAETIMDSLGYNVRSHSCRVQFENHDDLLRYLQTTYGSRQAIELMSDSVPVFRWECQWTSEEIITDTVQVVVTIGEELRLTRSEYQLSLSVNGRPIGFKVQIPSDSVNRIDKAYAVRKARYLFNILVEDTTLWDLVDVRELSDDNHRFYRIHWKFKRFVAGLEKQYVIDISSSKILGFQQEYAIPPKSPDQKTVEEIIGIASFLLVYMLFVILGLVYLIKRLRSDQVDLLSGLIPGVLVLASWTIIFWHTDIHGNLGTALLGYFITTPFVAGALWILFVLGESFAREVWSEKLQIFDQIRKGIFTSHIGLVLVRGTFLGIIYLTLHAIISYLTVNICHAYFPIGNEHLILWSTAVPSVLLAAQSLMSGLYLVIPLCLFFLSLLKRYFKKTVYLFIFSGIVWSMVCPPIHECAPILQRLPMNLVMGLFVCYVFLHFELFTAFSMVVVAPIMYQAGIFLLSGTASYEIKAYLIIGFLVLIFILGIWLLIQRKTENGSLEFVPDYMKRIYNRERLKRELEIARNVQLNFLPQENPKITGLDIASLCVPAREVGGDYFDFIQLGENKLGVVIGDVSGKGIPAAFYMTLTKGLFKSLATSHDSPREVLIRLNQLFFENAKRGIFISMIYGVFDLEKQVLTFARAGHNPMILHRSREDITEELCPPGIAIGFKSSDLFEKTIQEHTLPLRPNDIFLFYTDGLNEARNSEYQEFGDERIQQILSIRAELSVHNRLKQIESAIQTFTGKAERHDDMTAVLIQVEPCVNTITKEDDA